MERKVNFEKYVQVGKLRLILALISGADSTEKMVAKEDEFCTSDVYNHEEKKTKSVETQILERLN